MTNEIRIYGPPGAGKTTTLSGLIASACKDYGSEAVLVSSFTKAAAKELVRRDLPLNDDQIGTLHALCYRSMDQPKIVSRQLLADWNAEHPHLAFDGVQADVDDPYADFDTGGAKHGDKLMQECNRRRGLQVPQSEWPLSVQAFYDRWKDFKANTHTIDFTDLIDTCVTEHVPIPNRAKVLFLDEVQDFSPLELTLARSWGQACEKFYLAGDDQQCLYHFKGATPMAFLYPEVPQENIRILRQSYRVPRAVHASAQSWGNLLSVYMPKEYRPRDADGEVGVKNLLYRYPDPIYSSLLEWLNAGKSVAFLASCSFLLDPLKHKLRAWGLPFHNPYRRTRGDWNPLHAKSGTVSAGERVLSYLKIKKGEWWTYADLWKWASMVEADKIFSRGAKTAMRKKAEEDETATLPVDETHLESWIQNESNVAAIIQGDLNFLTSYILSAYRKPVEYACKVIESRGEEALKQSPQIILGTIHSMKGGEADVVVVFPDLSPSGFTEWVTPGESKDSVRRMYYVAITRAKESLYWAQPSGRSITGYL